MPTAEFDVFLSHNSLDKPEVHKLFNRLKELGFKPFFDARHFVPGENWMRDLDRVLETCNCCAVIVGPHGMGNVHEDEMWLALHRSLESKLDDHRFRIIPILLPNSTRGDRAKMPRSLRQNTWIEFYQSIEDPVALDRLAKAIRGEAMGERLKLPMGESPYRGLSYFDVQHANRFFGREALTDSLLSRFRGTTSKDGPIRFLAIVGASGSGKSSLARAGLLAKLQEGAVIGSHKWPQVILRPENRPLKSLARKLVEKLETQIQGPNEKLDLIASYMQKLLDSPEQLHDLAQAVMPENDPDWRLVVFVDQFEELFTLNVPDSSADPSDARRSALSLDRVAFVKNLLHAAMIPNGRTIVILTMRADFYGKCASFPELAEAVSDYQKLVGPMDAEELRHAVEYPALLSGAEIESGLVDLLVEEVTGQSGALPLLQYALKELWDESQTRGTGKLTTEAYRELGGWKGALSRRADKVLEKFRQTPQEKLCRELFLRLVQPGEGTDDTKRLVRWEELQVSDPVEVEALEQVVRALADERLITTGTDDLAGGENDNHLVAGGTIEVIHEALIRDWGALRNWLDADREGLRAHHQLTEAAKEWSKSDTNPRLRDPSLLYTGTKLAVANELSKQDRLKLNTLERDFLGASRQAIVSRRRRTQFVWGGLIAAVLVMGLLVRNYVNQSTANGLVKTLFAGKETQVPSAIQSLKGYESWCKAKLQTGFESPANPAEKLRAALALVTFSTRRTVERSSQVPFLREQLLTATSADFPLIRDVLNDHDPEPDECNVELWNQVDDQVRSPAARFRALAALATFDPTNERWTSNADQNVAQFLQQTPTEFGTWIDAFRPIKAHWLTSLKTIFVAGETSKPRERELVATVIAESFADQPDQLLELLFQADDSQFIPISAKVQQLGDAAIEPLVNELEKRIDDAVPSSDPKRETLALRQVNSAITLLSMDRPEKVWPLLKHSPDPRVRSYLIHGFAPLGIRPKTIFDQIQHETDSPIRAALILSLGQYDFQQLMAEGWADIEPRIKTMYQEEPDSGLHSACEWLLRKLAIALPEVRRDEPSPKLSADQQMRIAQITKEHQVEVESIQQQLADIEATRVERQQRWEAQFRRDRNELPSLNEGLVLHYTFDDAAGRIAKNSVPGGTAGQYADNNETQSEPEWVTGVMGGAVKLNGTGGHFVCGNDFNPERTDSFSFGGWFKAEPNTERTQADLFSKCDTPSMPNRGIRVKWESSTSKLLGSLMGDLRQKKFLHTKSSPVACIRIGDWRYLFVTYDGSSLAKGLYLYVDGVLVPKKNVHDNLTEKIVTTQPFLLGMSYVNPSPFHGAIDDVRIYGRCLRHAEVQALYATGVDSAAGVDTESRTVDQQRLLELEFEKNNPDKPALTAQLAIMKSRVQEETRLIQFEDFGKRWYTNSQGHTMVVVSDGMQFQMGSPIMELGRDHMDSDRRTVTSPRTFAISTKLVTIADFKKHKPNHRVQLPKLSPEAECPQWEVSWFDAASYCNWLSKEEGVSEEDCCYGQITDQEAILKANHLELKGYRLATEEEYEAIVRAGTSTAYSYGESDRLLKEYAWFIENSKQRMWPVGQKKPNDWGIYDAHGNVKSWTESLFQGEAIGGERKMNSDSGIVTLRGNSFYDESSNLRSATRRVQQPANRALSVGFRLARTLPPATPTSSP